MSAEELDKPQAIRVIIADDHPIVRRGICQILNDTEDITVIGEAADGAELMAKVRAEPWDVVVLDLSMPGRSGLELLEDVKTEFPQQPVLVLSIYPEDQFAVRVLKIGADGYMTKEAAPEKLVDAIRKVHQGGKYISATAAERLAQTLAQGGLLPHETLSEREFQVFERIAGGMSVLQIARELGLSHKTVSTYRARLLQKMKVRTNADLTRYALQHSLIS
ncbi:MAG TPA: response regulator transcription factor [Terriglobales bacterium]|nr:response regulator transcription factor [Terriglobales bacterium]